MTLVCFVRRSTASRSRRRDCCSAGDMLIVDAMNVIGSRPTGWWRDRPRAIRRLVSKLNQLQATSGDRITVVVDGRPLSDLPEGTHAGVLVLYGDRRGPNAADDRIVDFVAAHPHATSLTVVTSDRALIERVREHGSAHCRPFATPPKDR